jgi:hypothetical protein
LLQPSRDCRAHEPAVAGDEDTRAHPGVVIVPRSGLAEGRDGWRASGASVDFSAGGPARIPG